MRDPGTRFSATRSVSPAERAAATILIVSLGIVTTPFHLVLIEAAVGLLTIQAIVINRLAGIRYPLRESQP